VVIKIRKELQKVRFNKGFTQQEVADYLDMTLNGYQHIEYGKRDGSIEKWIKLEELLETPIKILFGQSKQPVT